MKKEETSLVKLNLTKKVRLRSMIALSIMAIIYSLIYFWTDHHAPQYAPYTLLLPIFSLIYALISANTLESRLIEKELLIPFTHSNCQKYRYFSKTLEIIRRVGKEAGFQPEDYTPYVMIEETPNAFASGTGKKRIVVLTYGLIEQFKDDPEALAGIIAHEFGHHLANDIYLTILVYSIIFSFIFFGKTLLRYSLLGNIFGSDSPKKSKKKNEGSGGGILVQIGTLGAGLLSLLIGYVICPIPAALLSRAREDQADATAESLGYGEGLQRAFRIFEKENKRTRIPEGSSALAPLFINEAHSGPVEKLLERIYSDHPPLDKRISNIQRLADHDEGRIPDKMEMWIRFGGSAILVILLGIYLYFQGQRIDIYLSAVISIHFINNTLFRLGGIQKINPEQQNTEKSTIIIGVILLILYWVSGLYLGWQTQSLYPLIAQIMFWTWISLPLTGLMGQKGGLIRVIHEISQFVFLLYSIFIVLYLCNLVPIIENIIK